MQRYLLIVVVGVGLVSAASTVLNTSPVAAQTRQSPAIYDSDGKMKLPTGYRAWIFLGAPLTPEVLNNNKATFAEYHHVYVATPNVYAYSNTDTFPERTVIVKVPAPVLGPTLPYGSP